MTQKKSFLILVSTVSIIGLAFLGSALLQQGDGFTSVQSTTGILQECIKSDQNDPYIEFNPSCSVVENFADGGWIIPVVGQNVGHPGAPDTSNLIPFTEAGSSVGVIIDEAFINANKNKAWYKNENGRHVIDGILVENSCLNIRVTLTLRNSSISCPVRKQANPEAWGYYGTTNNTPAIRAAAENILIERNTIYCTGFDFDICGRGVESSSRGVVIRQNDISGGRGAIQFFHDTTAEYNYMHSFSFGADPGRIGNTASGRPDEITHNNATNNQGYTNTLTKGNYIDARYGRVSKEPQKYKNPYFPRVYGEERIPEVGDPINGFTFTNYLNVQNGTGTKIIDNLVLHSGRPFRCNSSATKNPATCLDEFSGNAFVDNYFDEFGVRPLLEDKDGKGAFNTIACNYLFDNDTVSFIPTSELVRSGIAHNTSNCGL